MNPQRRDYLARHLTAMQMSVHLLGGEKVSLADEVEAMYDVRPDWNEIRLRRLTNYWMKFSPGGSIKERTLEWERSLKSPWKR